jgi:hypothetical protein
VRQLTAVMTVIDPMPAKNSAIWRFLLSLKAEMHYLYHLLGPLKKP